VSGNRLIPESLWQEYFYGKQTYDQLSQKHNCSKRTIQRKLDLYTPQKEMISPNKVIIVTDSIYWGRGFGVTVFKDVISGKTLKKYYIKSETNDIYRKGIKELQTQGFEVIAIVCDGRRGLLNSFTSIPVQMCQFHQVAIIRRYITKSPKMQASIELQGIINLLKQTDKESFEGALNEWYTKWEHFLKERTINPNTNKSTFTHRRLRSAYKSLKSNLKWLFTWYDNIHLNIPNTTNSLEGQFADLKNKMRNHNGLSQKRKVKLIDEFFKA
jgi:hypothetical protein